MFVGEEMIDVLFNVLKLARGPLFCPKHRSFVGTDSNCFEYVVRHAVLMSYRDSAGQRAVAAFDFTNDLLHVPDMSSGGEQKYSDVLRESSII
jgi:hypothetical protein